MALKKTIKQIEQDLPEVMVGCNLLCDTVEEIHGWVKEAHINKEELHYMIQKIRSDVVPTYLHSHINDSKRDILKLKHSHIKHAKHSLDEVYNIVFNVNLSSQEISKLEEDIAKSDVENFHDFSRKKDSVKYFNRMSKVCYQLLMKELGENGGRKNMYLIEDPVKRDHLIKLAAGSIAYSGGLIEIVNDHNMRSGFIGSEEKERGSRRERLLKDLTKNHFRNAECYEFLDSDMSKNEYLNAVKYGKKMLQEYDSGAYEMTPKCIEKLKRTLTMVSIAYERLGNIKEGLVIKSRILEISKDNLQKNVS